ncbi:hypothetical protein DFJ77DRAFT_508109 [Powellomyces hirtus]|nr:hypothetical protein DFJ77DRAFT_508109 [Powellomyces hirtus]
MWTFVTKLFGEHPGKGAFTLNDRVQQIRVSKLKTLTVKVHDPMIPPTRSVPVSMRALKSDDSARHTVTTVLVEGDGEKTKLRCESPASEVTLCATERRPARLYDCERRPAKQASPVIPIESVKSAKSSTETNFVKPADPVKLAGVKEADAMPSSASQLHRQRTFERHQLRQQEKQKKRQQQALPLNPTVAANQQQEQTIPPLPPTPIIAANQQQQQQKERSDRPPPPKSDTSVQQHQLNPARSFSSLSTTSLATTDSASSSSLPKEGNRKKRDWAGSSSGSRGSSSGRNSRSKGSISDLRASTQSKSVEKENEEGSDDTKRNDSFVNLKRSASTISLRVRRKFSAKSVSVFDVALEHGSSSQVHSALPASPALPTLSESSPSTKLSAHFGSRSPSYSCAQISPTAAFKIAEALLTSNTPSLAIPHLHQAACNGHTEAQYTIAVIHTHGIPRHLQANHKLAVTYYRLAANSGYAPAQCNLGVMYADGLGGLPRDLVVAREWFRRSAEGGFPEGMWNLARTAWQCGDFSDARKWFVKAGKNGCPGASQYLRELRSRTTAEAIRGNGNGHGNGQGHDDSISADVCSASACSHPSSQMLRHSQRETAVMS